MYALKTENKKPTNTSLLKYKESDLLLYSGEKLYRLITDVERYPEFLPGWLSVKVTERNKNYIKARQKIGMPFVNWEFNSHALLEEPAHIQITSTDKPFRHLDIHWNIEPMTQSLSRVTIRVSADIDANVRPIWSVIIKQSVHSLLEHFNNRARELYG